MHGLPVAVLGMSMPELSLIFFMVLFAGLVLRLALSRTKRWEQDARIPLDESGKDGGTKNVR
jgi:hypothetical protein